MEKILAGVGGTLNEEEGAWEKAVSFICTTEGDGLWSAVSKDVPVTRLQVYWYWDEEEGPGRTLGCGELRAYFDTSAWNIGIDGLIYTDQGFIGDLGAELESMGFSADASQDIEYSEQGMQEDDYVSFDVGEKFLQEVMNSQKEEPAEFAPSEGAIKLSATGDRWKANKTFYYDVDEGEFWSIYPLSETPDEFIYKIEEGRIFEEVEREERTPGEFFVKIRDVNIPEVVMDVHDPYFQEMFSPEKEKPLEITEEAVKFSRTNTMNKLSMKDLCDSVTQTFKAQKHDLLEILAEARPKGIGFEDLVNEASHRWGHDTGEYRLTIESMIQGLLKGGHEIWIKPSAEESAEPMYPGQQPVGKLWLADTEELEKESSLSKASNDVEDLGILAEEGLLEYARIKGITNASDLADKWGSGVIAYVVAYIEDRMGEEEIEEQLGVGGYADLETFVDWQSEALGSMGPFEEPFVIAEEAVKLSMTLDETKAKLEALGWDGSLTEYGDIKWPKANLRGANLRGANLFWANLGSADLSWADLRGANLSWADLREADLRGADLQGADLQAANSSWADLRGAMADSSTQWPIGFDPEARGVEMGVEITEEAIKLSELRKVSKIVKHKDGYHVTSSDGKKNLGGPYKSKAEALKRLRQVEYFKHRGSLDSPHIELGVETAMDDKDENDRADPHYQERKEKLELYEPAPAGKVTINMRKVESFTDEELYEAYCNLPMAVMNQKICKRAATQYSLCLAQEMGKRGTLHYTKKGDGRGEKTPKDVKETAERLKGKEGVEEPFGLAWYLRERSKAKGHIRGETKHKKKTYKQLRGQNVKAHRERAIKSSD